jgi:hypothetical protein
VRPLLTWRHSAADVAHRAAPSKLFTLPWRRIGKVESLKKVEHKANFEKHKCRDKKTPKPVLLDSILPRLPPEGEAWLNRLNPFCQRAVEHDLRVVGPELFVQYWERLRDTLQKLERDFGPSDNWK